VEIESCKEVLVYRFEWEFGERWWKNFLVYSWEKSFTILIFGNRCL